MNSQDEVHSDSDASGDDQFHFVRKSKKSDFVVGSIYYGHHVYGYKDPIGWAKLVRVGNKKGTLQYLEGTSELKSSDFDMSGSCTVRIQTLVSPEIPLLNNGKPQYKFFDWTKQTVRKDDPLGIASNLLIDGKGADIYDSWKLILPNDDGKYITNSTTSRYS